MSTDRITITKLASDSSNWVMYRDQMTLTFRSQQWSNHFTTTTVPQSYINAGDINGQTPDQQWAQEEDMALDLIATAMCHGLSHLQLRLRMQLRVFDV